MTFEARRLARAGRRLNELRAWRNAREFPVPAWVFDAGDGTTRTLHLGEVWPVVATPVRLAAEAAVPAAWAGEPVELELWLGGEGFVELSTGLAAGLDPHHHAFPVAEAARGGEAVQIRAEVSPKGMFGSHIAEPRLTRAHLVVPIRPVRALERDVAMALEATEHLGEAHEAAPRLLDAVEAALAELALAWPTASDVTLARLNLGHRDTIGAGLEAVPPSQRAEAMDASPYPAIWHLPPAPRPLEPLPPEAIAATGRARAVLAERIEALKAIHPPVGNLALTGHAHIDLAWLWPLAETRRKTRRTFHTVLGLMGRYPDFTFNQSSAQAYAWLEEDDPALLERIKARVAEGRWEPVGGSWVEPDCQVTGGESFVRQLLYGQRYFQATFGRRATAAWLPDVFGFSGGVPQLLRGAGLTGFFTIKPTWNEANPFPHDLFAWEGVDGSTVTAHMFRNLSPAHGYNGNIAPLDTLGTWRRSTGKRHHPDSLLAFGWGDGGGGPTAKMLENYARIRDYPALPRLRMARVEEFFAALPPAETLPRWVGEIYFELHRGVFTTQGKVKGLNRAAEHRLLEAEAFAALAALRGHPSPGVSSDLEACWKTLLLNHFHDILPGSSIAEVYVDAHRQLAEVVAGATAARDEALGRLGRAGGEGGEGPRVHGEGYVVANAGLGSRPLTVLLPGGNGAAVTDASGAALPAQETADGLLVHDPGRTVPGLGWVRLGRGGEVPATPAATARAEGRADGAVLENDLLRVEVGADGTLHRVLDKATGREALAGRGNQLWAYVDKPRDWDAWDIDEGHEAEGAEVGGVERVEPVEAGPLRAAVRVERTFRGSRIAQTYRLLAGSRRLDIVSEIDWHERTTLLKARFPLAVRTHEATFETLYGAVSRATHRNTSWDAARFEGSAHRWADLSEPGYGVALLNDGKYGHGVHGNDLTLSLVRGPVYPDPLADEGAHQFTYALYPHPGDWTTAGVVAEAFALNSPLVAVPAVGGGGGEDGRGFVAVEGVELTLGALKGAEEGEGVILRLHEPHGARGTATLRFARSVASVEAVNLLEEPTERATPVTAAGDEVRLAVRPFEVLTLRVAFAGR